MTTSAGLFDDTVFQILEDQQGNFWMSCNKGIFRARKRDLDAFADGTVKRISCVSYGTSDGMRSAECNGGHPSGWKARDGRLWFPTVEGVVVIDPARVPVNALPPPVVLEEVLVDKHALLQTGSPAVLSPGKEKFEFRYTALSLVAPQKVMFRYRLEGEMHARGIATLQICSRCGRCFDHTVPSCPTDGERLDSPRALPYLLLGRYRFVELLAQGGMGIIISAHDEKLGRDVAVKLIRPEHFNNVEMKQRFEREARAVARIQHPGVGVVHRDVKPAPSRLFARAGNPARCRCGLRVGARQGPRGGSGISSSGAPRSSSSWRGCRPTRRPKGGLSRASSSSAWDSHRPSEGRPVRFYGRTSGR